MGGSVSLYLLSGYPRDHAGVVPGIRLVIVMRVVRLPRGRRLRTLSLWGRFRSQQARGRQGAAPKEVSAGGLGIHRIHLAHRSRRVEK
jgi:hypothetical protein